MATALMPLFRFPPPAQRGVERLAPVARIGRDAPRRTAAPTQPLGAPYAPRLVVVKGAALDLSV